MRVVLTYADYAALPNDGKRYEIHDGELVVTPSPTADHQRIVGALFAALRAHVIAHRLGEVFVAPFDVILADYDSTRARSGRNELGLRDG